MCNFPNLTISYVDKEQDDVTCWQRLDEDTITVRIHLK